MIKIAAIILSLISFYFFTSNKNNVITSKEKNNLIPKELKLDYPNEIKKIIDRSCIECHSTNGNMAKIKVNFDYFTNGKYSNKKLAGKLNNIANAVENNRMPPAKYIAKHPKAKLSDTETKKVIEWAKKQAKILSPK